MYQYWPINYNKCTTPMQVMVIIEKMGGEERDLTWELYFLLNFFVNPNCSKKKKGGLFFEDS